MADSVGGTARQPRAASLAVYGSAIALSAFLLFSLQPLVGRLALPVFGGVPAAWATVLAFFQGMLLLGYVYGHLSVTRLGLRRGAAVHVVVAVMAFVLLVVSPSDWEALREPAIPPGLNLLAILVISVGPPVFLLTATTPLLSTWYAAIRDAEGPRATDPYWLYALSNGASLAALLAYPLLFEAALGLRAQGAAWTAALGIFVVIVIAAALRVGGIARQVETDRRAPMPTVGAEAAADADEPDIIGRIDHRRRLQWFVLAAVPAGLLTAVTTFIATDLVSAPLLWVGPLAIYLGSYVVAFSRRAGAMVRWATICAPAAATLLWIPLGSGGVWPLVALVALELACYAVVATALHGRLAADHPPVRALTQYYVTIALAGVAAGGFVALVAPTLFPDVWEYALLVGLAVAALALTVPRPTQVARGAATRGGGPTRVDFRPFVADARARLVPYAAVAVPLALALWAQGHLAFDAGLRWLLVGGLVLLLGGVPRFFALSTAVVLVLAVLVLPAQPIFRGRGFFGVTTVLRSADGERLEILNGTTLHGAQYLDDARRTRPTTYYVDAGPIGDIFRHLRDDAGRGRGPGRSVGVVGLGAGTLAAYSREGDRWTIFEIDPVVAGVAEDARFFTYLRDAPARPSLVMGDGRLELELVADGVFDLLVLDAFSSDAIPVHLLTIEALADAMRTVAPDGLLAVHVSNRYYDLSPAVAAAARELGLAARGRVYDPEPTGEAVGAIGSTWVVLARDYATIAPLGRVGWEPVRADGIAPITDDRPDILRFLLP